MLARRLLVPAFIGILMAPGCGGDAVETPPGSAGGGGEGGGAGNGGAPATTP